MYHKLLLALLPATLSIASTLFAADGPNPLGRPNFVVIMADDVSY